MPIVRSILVLLSLARMALAVEQDHATKMAASQALFDQTVSTILKEHCLRCHGGEKTKSGLDLVTRESLMKGGDQGVAVVPGKPMESLLFLAVAHLEKEIAMPPKKPKLPAAAIAAIEEWIILGAAYDKPLLEKSPAGKAPMQVTPEDRRYWAYAPLELRPPPTKNHKEKSTIDRYLLAGHDEQGLKAAGPIAPEKLIRRAYLDLIGLPPTPEEIDSFVDNKDPEAYEKLITGLLDRPGYGERWARHWLDVARFAESHGFEHDYDRKYAFHFRDFVIRALNSDMPYNTFVQWQIAGDELDPDNPEALAATGFLGAGVYPTQITLSEAERIRFDATDDMVATMGSAMLATTVGCARCHDHKYDPIPTKDYYELLSAFTQTVRTEVDLETSKPTGEAMKAFDLAMAELDDETKLFRKEKAPKRLDAWLRKNLSQQIEKEDSSWSTLIAEPLVSKGGATFQRLKDGSYLASGPNPSSDVYTFVATSPIEQVRALRIEALSHPSMNRGGPGRASNGNIGLSNLEVTAGSRTLELTDPRATFNQSSQLHVDRIIDGNSRTGWAIDPQFGKDHATVFEISNPDLIKGPGRRLSLKLHFELNSQHAIGRLRISVSARPPAHLPLVEGDKDPQENARKELLTLGRASERADQKADQPRMLELYLQLDPDWASIQSRVTALESTRPVGKKEKVMICTEGLKPMRHHTNSGKVPDFYKESYYLVRGDPAQKNGIAPVDFLEVLTRNHKTADYWAVKRPPGSRTSMKRSRVAKWITDVDHGAGHLLARVIVNRLWYHHFGRGIVESVNDFGFQGSKPTHPALLDYLAYDLIENGWTLKRLHKKIMMTAAYQMGSTESEANKALDPSNNYWWKRSPRRLEAEVLRDNALAVSGMIDRRMYGAGTLDQGMKRRSIYFSVKRSKLIPMMQLFDWPDTMTSQGRRAITTTPSQALIFMNSPQIREMAAHFAKKVLGSSDPVGSAVYRAHGALPSPERRAQLKQFLRKQTASYGGREEPAMIDLCHALLASNEMIYVE